MFEINSGNSEGGAAGGVETLLGTAVDAVRALIDAEYAKVQNDSVAAVGQGLEMVSRLVAAAQIAFTDEVDQRGLATTLSCTSTRALLVQMLNIPARDAGARVRVARAIYTQDLPSGGETPAQLPVLRSAVISGLVDPDHTQTIVATMKRLPSALDPETVAEAEQALVTHAVDLPADQFRKVAQRLAEALDPDGTLDDRDPSDKAEFTIGARSAATGLTSINGKLDDLGVEVLRAAIDNLSAPTPEADGIKDPRSAATRRAHALVDVLNLAITHADLPTHGGERPHITITLNWDVLQKQAGTAVTDHGATLTPATTRKLLCDAAVIPAVLGGDSEVLDLGRSARTFNRAIRRAITLRDRGCAFPGCDRPPAYCDSHHIHWWQRDLGDTSYENGCLLCAFHHTEIHKNQWQIQTADDGTPEFIPPPFIDPHQRPRRNTVHSLAPVFDTDTGSSQIEMCGPVLNRRIAQESGYVVGEAPPLQAQSSQASAIICLV